MQKREQTVQVVKVELTKSINEATPWARVELNTGHSFTCRPTQAPRVGDALRMTLDSDDSLEVVRPLADRILDAATMRVPNAVGGVTR